MLRTNWYNLSLNAPYEGYPFLQMYDIKLVSNPKDDMKQMRGSFK